MIEHACRLHIFRQKYFLLFLTDVSETWRGMILSGRGRVFSPTARQGSCRLPGTPSPSLALIIPRTTLTCIQRKADLKWLSAQGRKKKLAMSFPTALKQQTFCSVLLTLLSTPPPPFLTEFLHCGVETAKSLEVAFLSSNKKEEREKGFFFWGLCEDFGETYKRRSEEGKERVTKGAECKALLFGSGWKMAGPDFATKNAVLGSRWFLQWADEWQNCC